jgi:microcystin degradation protein MlrC
MLVIADGDAEAAAGLASALGEELWGLRDSAAPTYLSPDAAIAAAVDVGPMPLSPQ